MRFVRGLSALILGISAVCTTTWAVADDEPGTVTVPVLATDTYVQGAYDALDGKKQDKINNDNNAGANIAIDDSGKISLDLDTTRVGTATDGVYVLTAKVVNGVTTLKWENITRPGSGRDEDMNNELN